MPRTEERAGRQTDSLPHSAASPPRSRHKPNAARPGLRRSRL
ncbi:hypothetical protein Nmel_009279 [Mimus melanotis]